MSKLLRTCGTPGLRRGETTPRGEKSRSGTVGDGEQGLAIATGPLMTHGGAGGDQRRELQGSSYSGITHWVDRAPDGWQPVLNTRPCPGSPGLLPVRMPCPIQLPWASSTRQECQRISTLWRSWMARIEYRVTGWDLPLTIIGGRRTAQTRSLIGNQVASETALDSAPPGARYAPSDSRYRQ